MAFSKTLAAKLAAPVFCGLALAGALSAMKPSPDAGPPGNPPGHRIEAIAPQDAAP